jgi:ABC-type transporter Mla subunit MlaD
MVTDFPLSVTLTFNGSQATSGAQQVAQVFTDLATRMGTLGTAVETLNQSFSSVGQSSQTMGSSLNTANGALTTVGASANTTKTAFDGTKTTLDTTKTAFDTTKGSIDTTKSSLDTVKTSADTTKTAFDGTKTSLDTTKTSLDTVKTSVDTTKTSLDAEKTALDTTKTALEETKTGYDNANTSMETTNTNLDNVTTGITEQKDPLNQLVTEMDNFVSSGNQQVAVMEQQLTAIQQETPALKDITATLGETNTVSKDITPSLQAMTTEFTNAGSPLTNLNTQLTTHNTESATAKTKAEEFGSSLQTAGLAVTSIGTSVFNLIKNIRDYNDGQIKVEATARKVSTTTEALDKAQRKLDADIAQGITTGQKYEQDLLDRNQALQANEVAIKRNQEAEQSWSDSQVGIVFNSITAVTGVLFTAVGAVEKFGKAWTSLKAIMTGGIGMFAVATAGVIASAAAIQGYLANQSAMDNFTKVTKDHSSSWEDVAAAAAKAKQEMSVGLGSLINYGDIQDLGNIEKGAAHFAEKKSFLDTIFLGDIKKFRPALQEAIKARLLQAREVMSPANFTDEKGLPDVEKSQKTIAAYNTVISATVELVKKGTAEYRALHPAQVAVADNWKLLGEQATISASGIITNSNAWVENKDRQIESVVVGQQVSAGLDHTQNAIDKVTAAQNDLTKGITSVTDQSTILVKGITESHNAFRAEEAGLALVADKYGLLDTSMAGLALSEANNVNQMKETIAANIDYSAALTDTQTNQDLVAEGHLQGALKARAFFDEIVRGGAETEDYRNKLVAYATEVLHLQGANELTITQLEEEIRVRTEVGYAAEKERAEKQALKQAVLDVTEAYKTEEKQLVVLAAQNGVYNENLEKAALNETNELTIMKELVAASIDYTSALTNEAENAEKVADGHLAGALALKSLFDTTVKSTAQNETYSKGLEAITKMVGGLPPEIENTKENQELWVKTILGNTEALAALNKEIQDNVLKNFGELQKTWEGMVSAFAEGGDTWKDLKKQLKDLLPKELYQQVKMQIEVTADEQKLKASINLMEASIFKVVQDESGQHVVGLKPDMQITAESGTKLLENLKGTISDQLDSGDLSSVTGDKMSKVVQDGIDKIKADPTHYKEYMLQTFQKVDELKQDLGETYSVLTNEALESFKIDPKTIESAKAKIGPVGSQSAAEYNTKLLEELKKEGVSQEVIDSVKKTFLPVPEQGTTAGKDTGNAFSTALQESVALGQAQIDITTTVFQTMVGAWVTFNDTVIKLEEQLVQALVTLYTETLYGQGIGAMLISVIGSWTAYETQLIDQEASTIQGIIGLYTETLYGQGIGAMLVSAAESWRAYDEIILEQEGGLIEALVALYGETLLNEVIVATLVTAGESWAAYDAIVIEQEEALITAITGLYVETFYTAMGEMLITAAGSWADYESQIIDQEGSMIQGLVDLYIKTLYGDGIGAMLVAAAGSFKDYEETILGTEEENVEAIITEYESMTDQITQVLDDIGQAFEDGAEEWLTTVEDVVESIIEEFETIPDQVSQVVDDINSEIDKITKEVTVKVNYDTSGKPKATGADEYYPARAQAGIDFKTKRGQPQLLIVGEGATPERVTISRPGEPAYSGMGRSEPAGGGGGGGTMVVNDTINVYTTGGDYLGGARTRRVFRNLESH